MKFINMDDYRYETKYTLNDNQLSKFKKKVFNHFHFKKKYPDRVISTIYLDDAKLTDAKENIIGLSKRKKIRLRWYNNEIEKIKLEKKIKNNRYNFKKIYELHAESSDIIEMNKKIHKINDKDFNFLQNKNLFFIVGVRYLRKYFENIYGIRITLDSNISFSLMNNSKNFLELNFHTKYNYNIAEIKFSTNLLDKVKNIYSIIDKSPSRNSKYLNALAYYNLVNYF